MALVNRNQALGALAAAGAIYNEYQRQRPNLERLELQGRTAQAQVSAMIQRRHNDLRQFWSARARAGRNARRPAMPTTGNRIPAKYGGKTSRMLRRRRFRKRGKRPYRRRARKGKTFLSKMYRALCTPMVYKTHVANAYSGAQGQMTNLSWLLGSEKLLKYFAQHRPSNFLFNTVAPLITTTPAQPAVLQDFTGSNYRLAIDKLVHDMRIQNRANAHMELKIYECIVREQISSSNINTGSGSLRTFFEKDLDIPTGTGTDIIGGTLKNLGPSQTANPTGVNHMWQHPSFNPFYSSEFTSFFKVLKVHSRTLGPNEIWPYKFALRKKSFSGQDLESPSGLEWMRGWSKVLLFQWRGQPIDDNTTNNQTLAKVDLFIQDDITAHYHFIPGTSQLVNFDWAGTNVNGIPNQFDYNPASATTYVVPAETIAQTVTGSDEVPEHAP